MKSDRPAGLTSLESGKWVAPLPDDQKPVDPSTSKCVFCGRYHGAVNVTINCLQRGIQTLREALSERDAKIRSLTLREGILLAGWTCIACGAFNGSDRELSACRACGEARAT
jgi:ribosomal protein S14